MVTASPVLTTITEPSEEVSVALPETKYRNSLYRFARSANAAFHPQVVPNRGNPAHSSHKPQPPTCGDFVDARVWIRAKGRAGRQIRVNALEHLRHGLNLLGGEPLQSFSICFADDAPDQLKNGFCVFRDCKRPHPAIARAPATL